MFSPVFHSELENNFRRQDAWSSGSSDVIERSGSEAEVKVSAPACACADAVRSNRYTDLVRSLASGFAASFKRDDGDSLRIHHLQQQQQQQHEQQQQEQQLEQDQQQQQDGLDCEGQGHSRASSLFGSLDQNDDFLANNNDQIWCEPSQERKYTNGGPGFIARYEDPYPIPTKLEIHDAITRLGGGRFAYPDKEFCRENDEHSGGIL